MDGNILKILPLVRQAVELGADIIKADPADIIADYHKVVQIAGTIPILARGGGRAGDMEILTRNHAFDVTGCKGKLFMAEM